MSTPHCSLILYLAKDEAFVPDLLRDLRSFFAKFPVQYEIIALVEKGAKASLEALQSSSPAERERLRIHENTQHWGRARSLYHGLNLAEAPALLILNAEMASPLGELFKMWQHLVSDEQLALCYGNRYTRKDSPFTGSSSPRVRTEHFFNQVLKQMDPASPQDLLCEVLAVRKSSWEKIRAELNPAQIKGWYLRSVLRKSPTLKTLKTVELPVYDSGASSPSYSLWKERWRLIKHITLK